MRLVPVEDEIGRQATAHGAQTLQKVLATGPAPQGELVRAFDTDFDLVSGLVGAGPRPLDLVRLPVAPLVDAFGAVGRLPLRAHVEQVDEEVDRQRPRPLGEDAVRGLARIRAQGSPATDEYRISGAVSVSNCARSTNSSSADVVLYSRICKVARSPSPALLGKVARSAGWGVARCRNLSAIARTSPRTFHRRIPVFRTPVGATCRDSCKGSSSLAQRRTNAVDDDRQSADDELVGKSKNAKSRASKPCIPLGVLDLRIRRLVRAAVGRDRQAPPQHRPL